jgi:predicted RNA-binding protein YlqC (UPF0109 family)
MKDLLIQIAQALVDNPEQVRINEIEGTHTTVLELRVAKEDMGRIIGKQGKNSQCYPGFIKCSFWEGWEETCD